MNKFRLLVAIILSFGLQSAEMSLKEQHELIDNQQQINMPAPVIAPENIQDIIDKNKSEAITYLNNEIKKITEIKENLIAQHLDPKKKLIHALKIRNYIKKLESAVPLINDHQFRNAIDILNALSDEYPEEVEFKEAKIRLNKIIKILAEFLADDIQEAYILFKLNSVLEKLNQQSMYEKLTKNLYTGKSIEKEYLRDKLLPHAIELIKQNKKNEALNLLNNIKYLELIDDSIKTEIEEAIKLLQPNELFKFPIDISDIINSYVKPYNWVELFNIEDTSRINSISWSPDGSKVSTGSCNGTKIWDAITDNQLKTLNSGVYSYSGAWSSDGTKLALSLRDNTVRIWDINSGNQLKVINSGGDSV